MKDLSEEKKQFIIKRREAVQKLEDFYKLMDSSALGMTESLNSVARDVMPFLTFSEKELLQKRYTWFASFLRHFRLGDDCLHLIKEIEVMVEMNQFEQWTAAENR